MNLSVSKASGNNLAVFVLVMFAFALTWTVIPAQAQQSNATGSSAAVPQIIQFNGQFNGTAGGGTAVSAGTVSITFTLYENEQGGTALWSETQNVQVDAQGHYTALLGSASPEGLPLRLFTTGQAHWLAVQPLLQGIAEEPRVLLVSAPYALKAGDAETIGGLPPSAFMRADAALGAPGTTAISNTASNGSAPSLGPVSGSATTPAKRLPPSTPLNYNVSMGYQINGYYVATSPGGASGGNTGLGINALVHNSSGLYNSASGYAALFNNTSGQGNTASGWGAMKFHDLWVHQYRDGLFRALRQLHRNFQHGYRRQCSL